MNELSLYILDISENSIHANSKNLYLEINENKENNILTIIFKDDGKGMDTETLKRVTDPFYTTRKTRKVGLGIPLFKELCELCEGNLKIESIVDVGTTVTATFKLDSIDLPPLGSIEETLYCLIYNEQNVDIYYKQVKNDKEFILDTKEIKETLDGVPLNDIEVSSWLKEFINEGIKELII